MILKGQIKTNLLRVRKGSVNLCNDTVTESYSIGLTTTEGFQWKYISKELHDLLVKELKDQPGKGIL